MAKVRSPSYPGISLRDAIQRAGDLFDAERHNPISREAAAKVLGYSGLTGGSNKMLADLSAYGLIQRVGKGEIKVASRFAQIVHPNDDAEYAGALEAAAHEPKLFTILRERFPDHLPGSENLEGYLVRMGFSKSATRPAMRAFQETFSYLQEETGSESHVLEVADDAESDSPDNETMFGSASVGDLIQWECQGALQFETPRRVRWISEDGDWLAVEGSNTGIPMSEVTVEQSGSKGPPPIPPAQPQAQAEAPPTAGQRKAVFPVSEGDVTFLFPDGMSEDGIEELEAYLAVFLKKEKRKAAEN